MGLSKRTVLGMLPQMVGGLRFPQLFVVTVALFALDVLIPDLIPFVDEILLGLASLLLASWKKKPSASVSEDGHPPGSGSGPVIDVEPED